MWADRSARAAVAVRQLACAVALLSGLGCGRGADGEVLSRAACELPPTYAAFLEGVEHQYAKDIDKAGLSDTLVGRPLSSIFTVADFRTLEAAAASGRCQRITYRSDGLKVVGFVLEPPPEAAAPHPTVLYARGGNREFGKVDAAQLMLLSDLADVGFRVVATQYRGVDGGDGADEFGGADVRDLVALAAVARALPGADPTRLFLYGGSRGAMEGLMALRAGLDVRAAAFRGGMYDLAAMTRARPEMVDVLTELAPDFVGDPEGAVLRRSARRWVEEVRTPLLLLHGREDWRVPVAIAEDFDRALADLGRAHRLVVFDGDEHRLAFHRQDVAREIAAWFRAHDVGAPAR